MMTTSNKSVEGQYHIIWVLPTMNAIDAARNLAKREDTFASFSSGANVAAALKLLNGVEKTGQ